MLKYKQKRRTNYLNFFIYLIFYFIFIWFAFLIIYKMYNIYWECWVYNKIWSPISLNSGFSSATWSMTALSTSTDDIVAQSDVTPEEASGVTEEKQMEKYKSVNCFSPVLPESSSGDTRSNYWPKITWKTRRRITCTRPKQREVTHRRWTSVLII